MIRVSTLYPNNKSSRFDLSYDVGTHMPLSISAPDFAIQS